jgi:peptide/nickel transport system ATP-binding protein
MQDAMTALDPAMPVGRQIAESGRHFATDPVELLSLVGIDDPARRARQYPGEFSGGMLQRAAVAIALAARPQALFADEPTTSLDSAMRGRLMELLDRVRRTGTAVLFVTHDLSLARGFADRALIMEDGKIVETGTTAEIFGNPRAAYTKELLRSAAIGDPANHTHGSVHYHDAAPHGHSYSGAHTHSHPEREAETRAPLLEARSLCKSYPLGRGQTQLVLRDISFAVYPGEITGLTGPSGIGKSTLARCLAGLEKPSGGTLFRRDGLRAQMIFQSSAAALNPRMTVERLIAEPLLLRDSRRPSQNMILALMDKAELEPELLSRLPGALSGGQRQRVAIARAIAAMPDMLIADEPVSSLDATTRSRIIHLLKRLKDEYRLTMLLISHDLHLLAHVSDRIVRID